MLPRIEIVEPVMSITKVGAGAHLYVVIKSKEGYALKAVSDLSLKKVVEMSDQGVQFIEVKENL